MATIDGKKLTAKSYIQNGLIAIWDGIENIGYNNSDKSSNIWIDLIGGRKFILYNSTSWVSKGIENKTGAIAYGDGFSIADDDIVTIEYVLCDRDLVLTPVQNVAGINSTTSGKRLLIWADGRAYFNNSTYIKYRNFSIYLESKIDLTLTAVYSNGETFGWMDGETKTNSGGTTNHAQYNYYLGTYGSGSNLYPFRGTISCIRIYNKVLNNNEIKFNYKIDKARFNL